MATHTYTVGIGGNFENFADAYQWLYDQSVLSALTDHYVFNAISNTQHTSYPNEILICNLNQITIEFNGNGYRINCNTTDGLLLQVTNPGKWSQLKIHDFIIEMNGGSGSGDGTFGIRLDGELTYIGTEIYNCFLYNLDPENTAAAIDPSPRNQFNYHIYWKIYNCIAVGFSTGISRRSAGTVAGAPGHDANLIENCSFFNCGFSNISYGIGSNGYALNGGSEAGPTWDPIKFRNVYCLRNDGVVGRDSNVYLDYPAYPTDWGYSSFENCATSDESTFADLKITYPNQVNSCWDNFSPSDHLLSTVRSSSNFLRPNKYPLSGTGIYNGGTTPENPEVDYGGVNYGSFGFYPIGAYNYNISENIDPSFIGVPRSGNVPLDVQFTDLTTFR